MHTCESGRRATVAEQREGGERPPVGAEGAGREPSGGGARRREKSSRGVSLSLSLSLSRARLLVSLFRSSAHLTFRACASPSPLQPRAYRRIFACSPRLLADLHANSLIFKIRDGGDVFFQRIWRDV